MAKSSCYGCDYFFTLEELTVYPLEDTLIQLCPECLAKQ